MRKLLVMLFFITQLFGGETMSIYDVKVKTIDGEELKLEKYKGRVMLIVNVASKCGYTRQYEGLQKLHEKYNDKGLSILGFPCNQFLFQEPGTQEEIKNFCMSNFGVTFDMFEKIDVNGENTHPLYKFLKESEPGFLIDTIKWNFTKFLVDRDGKVLKRYAPVTTPAEIEDDIKKRL
jgi:glutathione peroxidase